ncbi:Transposase [compost metagenome]
MGKYSDQTKLDAVKDYCSGNAGLKDVARHHDVNVSSLRQWVAGYRAHGEIGVRSKKRSPTNYSAEFKLLVLQRMHEEGLSQRQVAALFNIRRFNVIGEWEKKLNQGGPKMLERASVNRRKDIPRTHAPTIQIKRQSTDHEQSHQDLLDELDYLRMENAYLKKLAALVRTSDQQQQKCEH